jgi:hypothetical protein
VIITRDYPGSPENHPKITRKAEEKSYITRKSPVKLGKKLPPHPASPENHPQILKNHPRWAIYKVYILWYNTVNNH